MGVEGEEDVIVSHLASLHYIEVGGEVHETPFQYFEVVNVEMVSPVREEKKAGFQMISWKDAQTVIKVGYLKGWGRVLELPVNKDHVGLGYHSQNLKKLVPSTIEGQVLLLPVIFTSVGHLVDS